MKEFNEDKIVDKIKKLLALSKNNPSEQEAQAAMLKAQELMAQYNIDIETTNNETIEYSIEVCNHKWNMGFRKLLGAVIADNFRCKMFLTGNNVTFLGHKADAKIAREVFEYAYEFALRQGNKFYNRAYTLGTKTRGVFNSYVSGFIRGLESKLQEQCRALVLVTPKDVQDKFEEMSKDWKTSRSSFIMYGVDKTAYQAGIVDGSNILNSRQLKG